MTNLDHHFRKDLGSGALLVSIWTFPIGKKDNLITMKAFKTVCFLEIQPTNSNGVMTSVFKTARGHFAKSWKLMSKLYRIHQMVTQIFYNYESTNFSQNQIVYLFLCTVNVNYLMHIFYWINVLNSSNYLPQWWVEFDNELSWLFIY